MVDNNVGQAESGSDIKFKYEIVSGDQHSEYPFMLGRTIRYTLNVKVVTSSGIPLEGTKFTVKTNAPGNSKYVTVSDVDKEHVSTQQGVDFLIYGSAFDDAAEHSRMNFDLHLTFTTVDTGYSDVLIYKMGRLQRWGRPVATLSPDGRDVWFRIPTEWLTEKPGVSWHWSENIVKANMSIPSLGVHKESFTTPLDGGSLYGRVECVHAIPIGTFNGLDKVVVEFPVSISRDGFTATLPVAHQVELPAR